MKKQLFLLPALVMAMASCHPQAADLRGNLTGVESDTILVYSSLLGERSILRKDTVALTNGSFELQLPDSALQISIIAKPKNPFGPIQRIQSNILYFPGDQLKVKGAITDFEISGSELYEAIAKQTEIKRLEEDVRGLNEAYTKAYREKNEEEKTRIKAEVKAKYQQLLAAKFEVVKANPSSVIAAYYATQLEGKQGLEAIQLLQESVKLNPMKPLLQRSKEAYERSVIREEAKEAMKVGHQAPDFQLTTIDGKAITLASFKGKHLLIDFWGTWCGWCVKGIPAMKKAYEKHQKHIEFLGISCRDTEAKWKVGVAQYKLPWVNAWEGETNVSAHFAVSGYPTKVLVDPEGKIVQVFVGESEELYQKLDQLFGK